jgi:hypothetical protein
MFWICFAVASGPGIAWALLVEEKHTRETRSEIVLSRIRLGAIAGLA